MWNIQYWILLAQFKQNIVIVFTWLWSGIKVTTTTWNSMLTHFDMWRYFARKLHLHNVTYGPLQLGILIQMEKPNSFDQRRAEGPEIWRPRLNAFTTMAQMSAHCKLGSAAITREMERRRLFSSLMDAEGVPVVCRRHGDASTVFPNQLQEGALGRGRTLLPSTQQRFDSTLIWGLG